MSWGLIHFFIFAKDSEILEWKCYTVKMQISSGSLEIKANEISTQVYNYNQNLNKIFFIVNSQKFVFLSVFDCEIFYLFIYRSWVSLLSVKGPRDN